MNEAKPDPAIGNESKPMTTPTPRTDEFYYERNRRPSDGAWLKYARRLERDLAAAQSALKAAEALAESYKDTLQSFYDYGYDRQKCFATIDAARKKL